LSLLERHRNIRSAALLFQQRLWRWSSISKIECWRQLNYAWLGKLLDSRRDVHGWQRIVQLEDAI
jgi:hypothetical protein